MLRETLDHLTDQITTVGLTAVDDPRDLNLPGIWITPEHVAVEFLDDLSAGITITVVLVAGDAGLRDSLDQLDHMVQRLAPLGIGDWRATSILLPNHAPQPLPALRGTTTLDWRPE